MDNHITKTSRKHQRIKPIVFFGLTPKVKSTINKTLNQVNMAKDTLQSRVGKQIIFYNILLIVITIVYFVMRGFDREEFTTLMGLLAPITAVYVGTLFRHIGNQLQENYDPKTARVGMTSYGTLIRWIIPLHFILILFLISAKALVNYITFEEMTLIFAFVETSFGAYVGYIISSLFQVKQ